MDKKIFSLKTFAMFISFSKGSLQLLQRHTFCSPFVEIFEKNTMHLIWYYWVPFMHFYLCSCTAYSTIYFSSCFWHFQEKCNQQKKTWKYRKRFIWCNFTSPKEKGGNWKIIRVSTFYVEWHWIFTLTFLFY